MIIRQRRVKDVTILDLNGRLIMDEGAPALKKKVGELLASGVKKIALNLAAVLYIDSAGTGSLATVWTSARKAKVRLKLFAPSPKVMTILRITRLGSALDVAPDEASALSDL
jgi:anti-anti-sigma factor